MSAQEIEQLRQELKAHDAKKPRPPLSRIAFVIEPTQPALLDCFANRSRAVACVADEGGTILGGHGMKADNAVGMFATLNKAWEGGTVGSERRTVESLITDNPRMTLAVAVQPPVMEAWRVSTGNLSRGSGSQARCLFSYPASTQGTRLYSEAAPHMPALREFVGRIRTLLDMPLTYDAEATMVLRPPVLSFTTEGKAAWVKFHDEAERELGPGGDLADARDVASKAAENVARLAALLHVFEHGPAGQIGAAHVEAAADIVTWHLYEAQRYFTEAAPTESVVNADKLEAWLVRRFHETGEAKTKTQTVLRLGPGAIRHRPELDAALAELVRRGRARKSKDGPRTEVIEVNPALLGGSHGA